MLKHNGKSDTAQGRIQDLKLGGAQLNNLRRAEGGFEVRGGAVKQFAPSGGRRKIFWGISCEKSRFYAKKSYFFQF